MRSSKSDSDKAGFDYYLERVQQAKGEAQRETQYAIMNSLAKHGGKMRLLDLAVAHLPPDAANDDITDFWGLVMQMQDAELVDTSPIEGDPAEMIQTMDVWLTDFGEKVLASGLGTQK
ncbi:MAG: hypothetical protein R3335_08080 [Anaerolineales bacterium]|nr:hypothetical protein [Anaerolineales bacterium]